MLDEDIGTDGGLCQEAFPCRTLYYALDYINTYQQDSNNVTVVMDFSNHDITNNTNSTYQKWNTSLSVSETDSNYSSSYTFKGQSPTISLVELFAALIGNDGAVYIQEVAQGNSV